MQKNGPNNGKYTFIISFIIDKDGNVKNVSAVNSPGFGMAEEGIRLIKNSPKWIAASQNGFKVAFRNRQEITFVVGENSVTEGNVMWIELLPLVKLRQNSK